MTAAKQQLANQAANPTFLKLQALLAEITGNDVEDIFPDSLIHEEFNMTPLELGRFLAHIDVDLGVKITRDELESIDSLADLALTIDETLN